MNIFIAFANQDRDVRDKLLRQMNLVASKQGWNIWSAKEIKAGERWGEEIERRLRDSEVVILLLSTDFFNSEYIIEKELPEVLEKHQRGECLIVPVIARKCLWKDTHFGEYALLGDIQALPTGERPIVSRGLWDSEEEPYVEVVEGVREAISKWKKRGERPIPVPLPPIPPPPPNLDHLRRYAVYAMLVLAAIAIGVLGWEKISKTSDGSQLSENSKLSDTSPSKQDTSKPSPAIVQPKKDTIPKPETIKASSFTDPFEGQMVRVEGGAFLMGSPETEEGRGDDECQHRVKVGSFYIGKYEVTQAQWKAVMGNNPSSHKNCDNCPVENVIWNDVQDFIKALNKKTGKTYRLPTEAEWEYAARGGKKRKGYKKYAGSDNLNEVAWYQKNSGYKTHPAGSMGNGYNELGLYDMSGNVWELCQDTWKPYPCDSKTTADGQASVFRGGSAFNITVICRIARRNHGDATYRTHSLGFRLAHD